MEEFTEEQRLKLLGYKDMLDKATPNGRMVHRVINLRTGINLLLEARRSLPDLYEEQIKAAIRILYNDLGIMGDTKGNADVNG